MSLDVEMRRAIGDRIEAVRRRLDRTPREFARLLGVPQDSLREWAAGLGFRQDDLLLIAEATDTPIDWLVEGLTDRDVAEDEETATVAAPPDPALLLPRPENRIRVRRVLADEELPRSIASALNLRPDSVTASGGEGPGEAGHRPSALFLDLPGVTLVSGARAAEYRLNHSDRTDAGGRLLLSLVISGRRRFEQMGRSEEGAEGSAAFVSDIDDGSLSYRTDGSYVSVFLPTQSLLARAPNAEAHLLQPIVPDSRPIRLIAAYVSSLMKSADGLSRGFAASAADHIVDLCSLMVGATGDQRALAENRGVKEAQRCQIADAIEAGAATPGFCARSIARGLGLTEREIHDLLWGAGQSYSEMVTDRRTAIAGARLVDPRDADLTIEEIAFLSGFMDFAKFNRAFEAQFGDAAADVRAGRKTARRRPGMM